MSKQLRKIGFVAALAVTLAAPLKGQGVSVAIGSGVGLWDGFGIGLAIGHSPSPFAMGGVTHGGIAIDPWYHDYGVYSGWGPDWGIGWSSWSDGYYSSVRVSFGNSRRCDWYWDDCYYGSRSRRYASNGHYDRWSGGWYDLWFDPYYAWSRPAPRLYVATILHDPWRNPWGGPWWSRPLPDPRGPRYAGLGGWNQAWPRTTVVVNGPRDRGGIAVGGRGIPGYKETPGDRNAEPRTARPRVTSAPSVGSSRGLGGVNATPATRRGDSGAPDRVSVPSTRDAGATRGALPGTRSATPSRGGATSAPSTRSGGTTRGGVSAPTTRAGIGSGSAPTSRGTPVIRSTPTTRRPSGSAGSGEVYRPATRLNDTGRSEADDATGSVTPSRRPSGGAVIPPRSSAGGASSTPTTTRSSAGGVARTPTTTRSPSGAVSRAPTATRSPSGAVSRGPTTTTRSPARPSSGTTTRTPSGRSAAPVRSGSAPVTRTPTRTTGPASRAPVRGGTATGRTTPVGGAVSRGSTPARSSGSVGRGTLPTRTSGSVGRSSPPTRSSGSAGRSSPPTRSSGSVGRSTPPTRSTGGASRGGATSRGGAASRGGATRRGGGG